MINPCGQDLVLVNLKMYELKLSMLLWVWGHSVEVGGWRSSVISGLLVWPLVCSVWSSTFFPGVYSFFQAFWILTTVQKQTVLGKMFTTSYLVLLMQVWAVAFLHTVCGPVIDWETVQLAPAWILRLTPAPQKPWNKLSSNPYRLGIQLICISKID